MKLFSTNANTYYFDEEAAAEEVKKFKEYAHEESKKIHIISLVGSICVGKAARGVAKNIIKNNSPEKKGITDAAGERLIVDLITGGSIILSYKEIEKWRQKFNYISNKGANNEESNN